jgi:hypothetical protein
VTVSYGTMTESSVSSISAFHRNANALFCTVVLILTLWNMTIKRWDLITAPGNSVILGIDNGKRTDSHAVSCGRSEADPLVPESSEFSPEAHCVNKSSKDFSLEYDRITFLAFVSLRVETNTRAKK